VRRTGARAHAPGSGRRGSLVLALLGLAAVGCAHGDALALPTPAELNELYGPGASVVLNGNVVDVRVTQERSQLTRGGAIWAKVGPYIYLFSPQTERLFDRFGGIGGVRVRTFDSGGHEIAQAMLERGRLNGITWKHALVLVSKARLEGTRRPSYMIDLVRYGEENTRYKYSARYVRK